MSDDVHRYDCPACKTPLLVDGDDIAIDRERVLQNRERLEKERTDKIEQAAKELLEDLSCSASPLPASVHRLAEALGNYRYFNSWGVWGVSAAAKANIS